MAYTKNQDELRVEFHEQLAALDASCIGFDAGSQWEARRIATVIFILFHDGGRNARSLLTQLGLKSGLEMVSCCQGWSETSSTTQMPLAMIKIGPSGASYEAVLDGIPIPPTLLAFPRWWDQPVIRDTNRRKISRKNLVFSIRHQDGERMWTDNSRMTRTLPSHGKVVPAGTCPRQAGMFL